MEWVLGMVSGLKIAVFVIVGILILGGISSNVDVLGALNKTVEELCSEGGDPRVILCAAIDDLRLQVSNLESDKAQLTFENEQLTFENEILTFENAGFFQLVADLQAQLSAADCSVIGPGVDLDGCDLSGADLSGAIAPIKSKYLIENLRVDTIDTGISWKIVEGKSLYVNIINSANISEDNLERVKNAIFSEDVIDIDNSLLHKGPAGTYSTHYMGWQGALKSAAKYETKLVIPTKFEIVESSNVVGDIFITLTSHKDTDGYFGFTKLIENESQNQILKSQITIYQADKLEGNQIGAILRHEMGHALGLDHSTAPEDLMAPQIQTEYPFISPCDIYAIISLYDGQSSSQIVCQI